MTCCCTPLNNGTGRFFSRFARLSRRRYLRHGLEPSQRQMIEGLVRAGFAGASILEIGSGVGYLHQHLLEEGAARAIGVDLSAGMLAEAKELARSRGVADRVDYRLGDFIDLAADLPAADVTLLDKVICCYPDAEGLVKRSLAKTHRVYALTLPRDRALNRVGVKVLGFFLWLMRSPFRNFVHDPRRIEEWITAAGFRRRHEGRTPIWLTQIYVRSREANH